MAFIILNQNSGQYALADKISQLEYGVLHLIESGEILEDISVFELGDQIQIQVDVSFDLEDNTIKD